MVVKTMSDGFTGYELKSIDASGGLAASPRRRMQWR